jgi:type IV secretion system protein VirD4
MKLFAYLEKTKDQASGDSRPSLSQQIKEYIEETRLKIHNKDKAFRIKAIVLIVLYLYVTGVISSVFRYFGEMANMGYRHAPKPTLTPWDAIGALFSFKYSIIAILITLLVAVGILVWWIRNHIGLGHYEMEERSGLKFKKQSMDATLGSAREMTEEEMVENFTVTPASEFYGRKNPGRIIFGRDTGTDDYVTEKDIPYGARPNRNTITVGSAGSFKTTNFIIPLVMQLSRAGENMIINDSSTEISKSTYHILKSRGYDIKIFNILNPEVSDGWNFIGAVGENPILSKSFARMIIDSSAGKGDGGDSFWPEGMYVLLSALILFVNTTPSNTIEQIRYILNNVDINEIPDLFEELPNDHPAKMEFNTYMTSPVQRNVLNGAAQRLAIFNSTEISRICASDGISIIDDLATPGKKTAIFIVTSAVDSTFSFIPSLFLTAAAVQLSDYAANNIEELTLPQPVHFIMDEFSNTGRIADIGRYLSATRKFGLVFHLIVQSFPQFYQRYDENEVLEIIGNCQYTLCFGAGEPMTAEFFEKYCGPTTVRTGMTASNSVVLKNTDQYREGEQQRSLFFANEILTMNKYEYLLLTNGMSPLTLKKAFWKNLEDSKYVKDFKMKDYKPQCATYRPTKDLNEEKSNKNNSIHTKVATNDKAFTRNTEVAHVTPNQVPQSFRNTNDESTTRANERKPGSRNRKNKNSNVNETPPYFFQVDYYSSRPPINSGEVITRIEDGKPMVFFKNNNNKKGVPRQAVLLRYCIDGTECKANGLVPDNSYVAVKTKLDLNDIEKACQLTKENSVLIGWMLKYKRGDKEIESKRHKSLVNGKYIYTNENGELVKSYSFSMPQSDCDLSPIFDTIKGAEKNKPVENEVSNSNIISTENTTFKM